jgi:ABC-2 type transport system permease protein
MRTWRGIVAFELRYYLERISTWVYFGIFFSLAFLTMCAFGGAWEGMAVGSRSLLANSPHRIAGLMAAFSLVMVPVTAALAGNAVYRDFETVIHPLVFTSGVGKRTFLAGRYAGAVLANLVVALSVPLGLLAASVMPFLQDERVGPFRAEGYLQGLLLFTLPNLLFTAALFMSLAALTRRMLPNYAGGILLLLGYSLSQRLINELDDDLASTLMDVFGIGPAGRSVRFWTLWEQNHLGFPLEAPLLWNRLLWTCMSAVVLVAAGRWFRFAHLATERRGRRTLPETVQGVQPAPLVIPRAALSASPGTRLRQYLALTKRAYLEVVGNVYFPVMVGACLVFLGTSATRIGSAWGTSTYPVTYEVLDLVTGMVAAFLLIIITFYSGELVWNDRELRVSQIVDALPLPGWLAYASRLTALLAVNATLLAVGMVAGIVIQLSYGFTRIEPGHYVLELCVLQMVPYALLAVLALLVHTLVNHKYVGHLVMVVYYVTTPILPALGVRHNLANYASAPDVKYSDMNGYGHALAPWAWFTLYWVFGAALLAIATNLMWVRGQETAWERRLKLARARLHGRTAAAAGGCAALMLATGGWIFYNTNVRNDFHSEKHGLEVQERYEKRFKRFEAAPQPRVTAVDLDVELYPATQELRVRGTYRLRNRTAAAIDSVHVDYPASLKLNRLVLSRPSRRMLWDRDGGYAILALAQPLAPGDSVELRWELEKPNRGFTNETEYGPVLGNGTFFTSQLLPTVGYNPDSEIQDEDERKRRGLKPRERVAALGDREARMRNFVSRDADWMGFQATIGTSGDQTAVAPGYLQRTWTAGGRRYFRYRMDAPMLDFYAFLSARYAVRRDAWKGTAIEVYHQPGHEYNLDRMVRSVKASLDYYTAQFGPYQHRQVRILEFPRYAAYAQSFDNTIPYSEAIGFIARVDTGDIDYPFFVTAHEVAHQWWGHQLVGADVQGAAVLSETLAEYSALMVMEKEYGRDRMRRFLRYELSQYLQGRGGERRREMPLYLAENQPYIHYHKGGLAMYALRDWIGEARVNAALRSLLDEQRFRGPPYATTPDLLRHLRAVTPDSTQHVVDDLFERVILFDNRAVEATYTHPSAGRWEVQLVVDAQKLRADSAGQETPVPVDDWIDVGVYREGKGRDVLELRRVHLRRRRSLVTFVLPSRPLRAGIDPTFKLIDRRGTDNVIAVTERATAKASPRPQRRR